MAVRAEQLGIINEEWAINLSAYGAFDIWRYNRPNAEEINSEVDLDALGGLVVRLGDAEAVSLETRRIIKTSRSVIDLAFRESSYATLTSLLLEASRSQRGEDSLLTQQLAVRSKPTDLHGGDESWHIPMSAVLLLEAEVRS
jgi:hypothetical protein